MTHIPAALRRLVIARAANRCEYCGLAQLSQVAAFHIDHVVPVVAGGQTIEGNLALACVSCSLQAARQTATDPETGHAAAIFNPRLEDWHNHFHWDGVVLTGTTAVGRATVEALALNRPAVLLIREEESY